MPQTVSVDSLGEIEFPDSFSQEQIVEALHKNVFPRYADVPLAATPTLPVRPVADELGIGEEVRGIGRAALRGVHSAVQAGDIAGLTKARDLQKQLAQAEADLVKFDAEFPNATPQTLPAGWQWRQKQLGTIGALQSELQRFGAMAPELAESLAKHQAAIEQLPPTTAEAEFRKPESSALSFFRNPVELALSATAESLPTMAKGMVGAAGGPVGVATGMGLSSFEAESSARVLGAMQKAGVNLKDPQDVLRYFGKLSQADPDIAKARLAAIGPAAFDALTGGLAGQVLKRVLGQGVKKVAAGTAAEIGMQMAGGGAGSIAGSKLAGEPIDWKDVILEMAAEIAPVEAVANVSREFGGGARTPEPSGGTEVKEPSPTPPAPFAATPPAIPTTVGVRRRKKPQPTAAVAVPASAPAAAVQPEEPSAEGTRIQTQAPGGQAPPLEQGEEERVRVRDAEKDRLAAQQREENARRAKEKPIGSPDVLYRIPHKESGMEAVVSRHVKGFSVTLRDIEADEFLPEARIFPKEDDALKYAHTVIPPKAQAAPQLEAPPAPAPETQIPAGTPAAIPGIRSDTMEGAKPGAVPPQETGTAGVVPSTPTERPVNVPTPLSVPQTAQPTTDREGAAITSLATRLAKPEPLNRREAHDLVAGIYGGGMAEGKFSSKDLTDLVELAVNKLILDSKAEGKPFWDIQDPDGASNIKSIKAAIMERIPTQTTRTLEQDKLQQFSTPPTLGYAANWVANITPADVVLEPSAGVGGLAVFPKSIGATVIANELSDRRADLLGKVPIANTTYRMNAEQLHARLEPEIAAGRIKRPTVVVMNPPFSNAAGTSESNTLIGAKHVEEALKLLPDGGRLVAIVGEGMAADRPAFKAWWKRINSTYNVRANIGISGEEYRKYGTTFGNQLLVIDKAGATPEGGTVTGSVDKVEDLIPLLNETRQSRPRIGEAPAQPGSTPAVIEGAGRPEPQRDVPAQPGTVGPRRPGRPTIRGPRTGPRPSGQLQQQPTAPETGAPPAEPGTGTGRREEPAAAPIVPPDSEPAPTQPTGPATGVEVAQDLAIKRELSEEVFSQYKPAKLRVAGAKAHPTELVESTAMAAVDPPDPTYKPNLPRATVTEGTLSDAQLESVVYAGQSHAKELPDGSRQGFFIGDGTGVGKGREIAGIIADNWRQGRKRAVWVSKTKNLINDAKRDLAALGLPEEAVLNLAKKPVAIDPKKDGIAFLTYTGLAKNNPGIEPATGKLRPSAEGAKLNRFQALFNWLGPDFDGVIAFDETHLAGNAVPTQGSRGVKDASDRGLAVVDLQTLFPKARILYVSATGATDVTNLSYGDRLGIWGSGTPFPTKQNFFEKIKAGGLSAMEIVSRDLKSMGRYLARTLSFKGVEQVPIEHPLTPKQIAMYDQIANGWQTVLRNVDETMGKTGANKNGRARAAAMSAFYGAQQRFFNQLLTALQMPTVLTDMEKQLASNNSIVLQIVNTNEATMERELAKKATEEDEELDLESLDLSPKDILLQYISNSFPTQLYEGKEDENGNIRYVPVINPDGSPVQDPEALRTKQDLLDRVALLPVPSNPLEMILDQFGVENVAEVTGRSRRVVQKKDEQGILRRVIEDNRNESKRKVEADEFQEGKRRILIFSDAGGTGFSYHASRKAKNQQRRIHYLIQAGWRADAALQGMGRTHRSDQAVAPLYKPVSTDLKGHQRFISTITRRLAQLGALTGGERKTAGSGVFDESSNLENAYAEDAVTRLFMDMHGGRTEGFDFYNISRKMGFVRTVRNEESGELTEIFTLIDSKTNALNVSKIPTVPQFLNRILALDVSTQNRFFDEFIQRLQRRIENAKADGTYDPGTQTLRAASIRKLSDEVVYEHPESTAKTRMVEIEAEHDVEFNTWEDIPSLGQATVEKYVRNKRSGRLYALKQGPERTDKQGNVVPTWRRIGTSGIDIVPRSDVTTEGTAYNPANYEELNPNDARKAWGEEIAKAPKRRKEKKTYVVGAFLPIWDRLNIPSPKIWRVSTDKETFLGADVPEGMVEGVRARLGAKESEIAPSDVLRRVVDNGETFTLANGWKIFRSRVLGEQRLEVQGPDFNAQREWTDFIGGYIERIDWKPRFFIATDAATGVPAIEKLLAKSPIVPAEADLIARLEAKKLKPGDKQLSTLLPGLDPETARSVWNTAIDIAIGLVKAGRAIGEAVDAALTHIRKSVARGFDEATVREALEAATKQANAPTKEPTSPSSFNQQAKKQAVEQDISLLNPDVQAEIREVLATSDEGVQTKVFNAFDTVIDREQMTPEVVANGVTYARNFFGKLGLQVEQDPSGFWKLTDEAFDQEIEGRKMVEALRKEIEQQNVDPASKGYLANLLNSVVVNMTPDRVTGFSAETRAELYSLAQGERSHRGLLLGMLSHGHRTVEYVARNVNAVLQRVYSDAFGGDTVRKFVDAVRTSFGGYFTGEVVRGAIEAQPELQDTIDRINADRTAEKIIPSIAELVQRILNTPLYRQGEIRERFQVLLQKTYEVDPTTAARAAELIEKTFAARYKTAKERALEKALKALTPQELQQIKKKKPIWKKIEQAVNAGVFETGELLKRIGQGRGWMPLTPEISSRMRAWAERMQRLRELTDAETAEIEKFSDDPAKVALEKQRALSDREALTRQERLALKKQIETMWSRLTHPLDFRSGSENIVNAAYEWASATLLLKFGFAPRQLIDVSTQSLIHTPTRAIQAAWDRIELNRREGRPANAAKEISNAVRSAFKLYLRSLKPALAKARAVLGGASTSRNVENLVSQVALFERIAQQADEADARGEHVKANLLTLLTWVKAMRQFAAALDHVQGLPAEYQEIRQQVVTQLRENGKTLAEAELSADEIVRDPLAEWQLAVSQAKALSDKLGLDYGPTEIRSAAEDIAMARAYQRMREAGMPSDDFKQRNAEFRETIGWNVQEEGGIGGFVGAPLRALSEFGAKFPPAAAFSIAFGRFANAISISATRAASFTPLGFFPSAFGVREESITPAGIATRGSAWYRTAADRRQRKVEAAIGTSLGSVAIALVAAGAVSVRWKPPDDKEDRELWFKLHKPYTVEFNLPDGWFIPVSLTVGPMRPLAPYFVAMGATLERMEQSDKRQARLNEDALKKGLTPGQAKGLDFTDYAFIAGQAAWSTLIGGRTATGLLGSVSDYGIPNVRKFASSAISALLPPLPALQEVARAAGIYLDPKQASFFDYLLPLDTSEGRSINLLGDKVSTEDDLRRVIQTATGGSYLFPVSLAEASASPAYAVLASGYRPPSINPNRGYAIGGQFRPFTNDELAQYTQLRGSYFKQELSALGPNASREQAQEAFSQANERALSEMGVELAPKTASGASGGGRTASAGRVPTGGLSVGRASPGTFGVRRGLRAGPRFSAGGIPTRRVRGLRRRGRTSVLRRLSSRPRSLRLPRSMRLRGVRRSRR